MHILYLVLLALSLSWVFSELLERIRLPRVLSPIFVGILLGIRPIKQYLLTHDASVVMSSFADIGLILLMFYIGFELNMKQMLKTGKKAVFISILCIFFSFSFGFIVGQLLGLSNTVSAILGVSIAVSAEAIAVNILEELKMFKSRIGNLVVAAGIIDNVIEIIMLAVIAAYTQETSMPSALLLVPFILIFAFIVLMMYSYVVPRILLLAESHDLEVSIFMNSIIMAMVFAVLSEYLGFGFVIGALLAGIMMSRAIDRHRKLLFNEKKKSIFTMTAKQFEELKLKMREHDITLSAIKTTTFGFLVPFFFIWIGINVDLSAVLNNPLLVALLTIAAISGQLLGSTLGNLLGKGTALEGFTVGWALNSRGSVELVFAELARSSNVISGEIFSAIVLTSLFTTLVSPVVFKHLVLMQRSAGRTK